VWAKQLADGGRAVVLFNRGSKPAKLSVSWTDVGYPPHLLAGVRDLWAGKNLGKLSGTFSAEVPSHGVVMVTINP
jgi:alpha-galactosidase